MLTSQLSNETFLRPTDDAYNYFVCDNNQIQLRRAYRGSRW